MEIIDGIRNGETYFTQGLRAINPAILADLNSIVLPVKRIEDDNTPFIPSPVTPKPSKYTGHGVKIIMVDSNNTEFGEVKISPIDAYSPLSPDKTDIPQKRRATGRKYARFFADTDNIILLYPKRQAKTKAVCKFSKSGEYAIIEPSDIKSGGAFFVISSSQLPKDGSQIIMEGTEYIRLTHSQKDIKAMLDFLNS